MAPANWEEIIEDCERRYQEMLLADGITGRNWAASYPPIQETIARLREHYTFEEVAPVISLATLVLRTNSRSLQINIWCEQKGDPYRVCLYRWKDNTVVEEAHVQLEEVINVVLEYRNKVMN